MVFPTTKKQEEQLKRISEKMSRIKNKLLVMSGKGGVGKTSVAVNLALALSSKGKSTGILDIDIHGPNVPKMLGIEGTVLYACEDGIEPVRINRSLKAVSIALLTKDQDQPIIWRGPLKTALIKQFLGDVNWGDLDYLIIDAPPGTGDEPLSVCQLLPNLTGAIIVTTPQEVAILDSRKSVMFAQKLNTPVIGIIENMSGFRCPKCGTEIYLFGKDGGQKAAEELNIPFLGRIPMDPEIVKYEDRGKPFIIEREKTEAAKAFFQIVERIQERLENE
ncbi:MAG: ATP-binding protein [Candidatus Neomarinimicrobiota bacterium]|nr:Mrp/NBP35 family ATP-binding protein [Candidatus Neomarinimicrobiota bacterium]RKY47302.1 MAG: ATP-binding protein [Candidatus Neomarinimicrobiota bacterium]